MVFMMKINKVLLFCLFAIFLSSQCLALDVEWANKSKGETFTHNDANAIKFAVNSKRELAYPTVAAMVADTLVVGRTYSTQGRYAAGDGGAGDYLIVAGDSSDGYINHLVNGGAATAVLQVSGALSALQAGAKRISDDPGFDSSAALTAWGNSGYKSLYLPEGGFLVSSVFPADPDVIPCVEITGDGLTIRSDGYLTVASEQYKPIVFNTNKSNIQININGGNLANYGIQVDGNDNTIHDSVIRDLKATTYTSIAIRVNYTEGGNIIRDNRIDTVNSVGNGSTGDGNGMSRGISITNLTQDSIRDTLVINNYIKDIIGEEGDALQVLASPGDATTAVYSGKVIFKNNTINYFTRRGFKVQADDITISDNVIRHTVTAAEEIPNIQGAISLVSGSRINVTGNDIAGCNFMPQISIYHTLSDAYDFADDIVISGNRINVSDSDYVCLSLISQGARHLVENNVLRCSRNRAINLGYNDGVTVRGNIVSSAHSSTTIGEEFINVANSNTKAVILNNTFTEGTRRAAILAESSGGIYSNNNSLVDMNLFRDDQGATGAVFFGNYSTGVLYAGSNPQLGSYVGGSFSSAANRSAQPLYAIAISSLGSLYVTEGQIVYNISPVAGGKIGWVALERGAADVVGWKEFGVIDM